MLNPVERIDVSPRCARSPLTRPGRPTATTWLGSLTPGKYADFVVLSDDPRTADPAAIGAIGVCQTRLAGAVTWTGP